MSEKIILNLYQVPVIFLVYLIGGLIFKEVSNLQYTYSAYIR